MWELVATFVRQISLKKEFIGDIDVFLSSEDDEEVGYLGLRGLHVLHGSPGSQIGPPQAQRVPRGAQEQHAGIRDQDSATDSTELERIGDQQPKPSQEDQDEED